MSIVKYIDRKNTNSVKWDGLNEIYSSSDLLAMWVAVMDFQVPESVQNALSQYINQGTFGYYKVPDGYYQSFIDWEKKQHNYEVKKEWIRFSPGVVSAFNWIIQFMTSAGDCIIVQPPVYYPFLHAVNDNKRTLIVSELVNENGLYHIDFEDFERKIVEHQVKLFILCSPHNPVGRVWTKAELERLLQICRKHNVYVISDEIHHDMVYGEAKHIPSLSVGDYDDMIFMLTAPSKTFNLAACQNSVIVIPDETLRQKWDAFVNCLRIENGNAFGYVAAEAAYKEGHSWHKEVCEIIYNNYLYLKETLGVKLSKAIISPLEGTYLAWIDLRAYVSPTEIQKIMEEDCKLAFDYGDWFGGEHFAGFVRMNLATSRENIELAIERMVKKLGCSH